MHRRFFTGSIMTNYTNYATFFYELGMLRRVQREGWKLLGITQPESVAEHSLRAAQIAYILAILEHHSSPEKVCSMLVFHDIGECRIGDVQKVANRYISSNEKQVIDDQTDSLEECGAHILSLWADMEELTSETARIAKDADLLELALTACEYKQQGFSAAQDWLNKTEKRIQTHSAKELFNSIAKIDPMKWWDGLKHLGKTKQEDTYDG